MTKLALYDKRKSEADQVTNSYFRHDFLYRKNLGTRLCVGLGGFILLAVYWIRVFLIDGVDIFTADLQKQAYESGLFLLALLAVYSLIGTIQGTRQYYLAQQRIIRYLSLLHQLERIEARTRRSEPEASDSEENNSLVYARPRNTRER